MFNHATQSHGTLQREASLHLCSFRSNQSSAMNLTRTFLSAQRENSRSRWEREEIIVQVKIFLKIVGSARKFSFSVRTREMNTSLPQWEEMIVHVKILFLSETTRETRSSLSRWEEIIVHVKILFLSETTRKPRSYLSHWEELIVLSEKKLLFTWRFSFSVRQRESQKVLFLSEKNWLFTWISRPK